MRKGELEAFLIYDGDLEGSIKAILKMLVLWVSTCLMEVLDRGKLDCMSNG